MITTFPFSPETQTMQTRSDFYETLLTFFMGLFKNIFNRPQRVDDITNVNLPNPESGANDVRFLRSFADSLEQERVAALKERGKFEQEVREKAFDAVRAKTLAVINVFRDKETADRAHALGKNDEERAAIERRAGGEFDQINDRIQEIVESAVAQAKAEGVSISIPEVLGVMKALTEKEIEENNAPYAWIGILQQLKKELHNSESLAFSREWEENAKPEHRKNLVAQFVAADPERAAQLNIPTDFAKTEDFRKDIDYFIRKTTDTKAFKDANERGIKANYLLVDLRDQEQYFNENGYPKWLSRQNGPSYAKN